MNWFSKFFGGPKKSSKTRRQEEIQKFPEWLQQQGDDISIQDALDKYIDTQISVEQVNEMPNVLAKQRVEVDLLEQLVIKYGESVSPEFNDLLFHKKLALQMGEEGFKMKCESQKALREARRRADSL